jgi:hypothetical protein
MQAMTKLFSVWLDEEVDKARAWPKPISSDAPPLSPVAQQSAKWQPPNADSRWSIHDAEENAINETR